MKVQNIAKTVVRQSVQESKNIIRDVVNVKYLPSDVKKGWQSGTRLANSQNMTLLEKNKLRAVGVAKLGVLRHLPGLLAAPATFLSPIPGSSLGCYALGKFIQKMLR